MIEAARFAEAAGEHGYSFYSGVPCSFLTALINHVISDRDIHYVGAASEGEAVAVAAGGHLAGRRSVALCQNSGLGNMVNPLTSLAGTFRIPLLLIVTHRGQEGLHDAPQHALMGAITEDLLSLMRVEHARFPAENDGLAAALEGAAAAQEASSLPYAFVVSKGSVAPTALEQPAPPVRGEARVERRDRASHLSRTAALDSVLGVLDPATAVVSTTGKTSRELFVCDDRPGNFYMVGSMGCAAGLGLGVAVCKPGRKVLVLDGDGAALMKLGTLATIGHYAPGNLLHVVLDNAVHDSTGAQATVSPTVDFAGVAAACNYRNVWSVSEPRDLAEAVTRGQELPGPNFVHVRTVPGSPPDLPRPHHTPVEIKERFMAFLASR